MSLPDSDTATALATPAAPPITEPAARITAFHGSDVAFDTFDPARIGTTTDEGFLGQGFYFCTDPAVARMQRFLLTRALEIENPLPLAIRAWTDDKRHLVREALGLPADAPVAAVNAALRANGHDGVTLDYAAVGYHHREVMVLSAEQIHEDPDHPPLLDRGTAPGIEPARPIASQPAPLPPPAPGRPAPIPRGRAGGRRV